jgi:hypothetical protein
MEVSGQLHAPAALRPRKENPVQETGLSVRYGKDNLFILTGIKLTSLGRPTEAYTD